MGFKRVSTKVLTVGTARWLIFRYGLDALAIGQCGSFHHLQRGFLWFKWGPHGGPCCLITFPLCSLKGGIFYLCENTDITFNFASKPCLHPSALAPCCLSLGSCTSPPLTTLKGDCWIPMFSYQKVRQIISRCFLCGLQLFCMFLCRNMVNLHNERLTTSLYQPAGLSPSLKHYHLILT